MGCSTSKLEDEEPVKLCRERKNFIKQAVNQRSRFAAGHLAYTESLRQVSDALRNYFETDDCHRDFFSDVCSTPPFTPVKKFRSPETIGRKSKMMIHCLTSGGNLTSLTMEERPPLPETIQMNSYYDTYDYDYDYGFFPSQPQEMIGSFSASPPTENPNWDFFWNPFSSESYGLSYRNVEEDAAGLRQIREEEGIPELEEEEEEEEEEGEEEKEEEEPPVNDRGRTDLEVREFEFPVNEMKQQMETMKVMQEVEETKEKTPGFTVYLNRKPTSMAEVMRDIEHQFVIMHESAREISSMLEASKTRRHNSNELMAGRLPNPVALVRSTSFRSSSSSRFLPDDGYDSEDSGMISGSHYSTLEKLYAWEKKLYEEVKGGEKIRVAYEKKCRQLRKQDINGEEPLVADRTRLAARDLQTHLKVSINSVEAISSRIDKLRDEELFPQLLELIQGMSRMWRTMADSHQIQKAAIDGAKHMLATAAPPLRSGGGLSAPAARLEVELRNWRRCLKIWVEAQRCYMRALAGWLLRCARAPENDDARIAEKSPLSPPRSSGAPPVFGLCVHWTRMLDRVIEDRAVEGLDFFAAGIFTVASQLREAASEAARRERNGAPPAGEVEETEGRWPASDKMEELAVRVLFAGMSVAVSALAEFAAGSRDGYEELQRLCAPNAGVGTSAYLQTGKFELSPSNKAAVET